MNPYIINLNIKPGKVLLPKEMTAKLVDFTWKTYIQEEEIRKAIHFILSYFPPETLGKEYDESNDI